MRGALIIIYILGALGCFFGMSSWFKHCGPKHHTTTHFEDQMVKTLLAVIWPLWEIPKMVPFVNTCRGLVR